MRVTLAGNPRAPPIELRVELAPEEQAEPQDRDQEVAATASAIVPCQIPVPRIEAHSVAQVVAAVAEPEQQAAEAPVA